MGINIKNFVDVNIFRSPLRSINATRDTVVLLTREGTLGQDRIFTSQDDYLSQHEEDLNTITCIRAFFNNGGHKVRIIEGIETETQILQVVNDLPKEQIIVGYCGNQELIINVARQLANEDIHGTQRKLFVANTEDPEFNEGISWLAMKLTSNTNSGIQMLMAAYLSRINIRADNSILDYSYTVENTNDIINDDAIFNMAINNNINVNIELAGAIRNIGGNLNDGADLTNTYALLILHQTLTEALLNTLTQKIKGEQGIASIYNSITMELNKYVNNGFLSTDKIWTQDDFIIQYNGRSYTVIERGTPLIRGYHVYVLPLSSLTQSDIDARKAPPIHVILSDSYGIRYIEIQGEVF